MKKVFNSYPNCLEYLFAQLPMYQRVGQSAMKKNLDNILALAKLLGQPQNYFKSIHIAGTNGKGSTAHFLASILQEYGLRVGLYTSPHYLDFRERIKINGQYISKKEVLDFCNTYLKVAEQIQASFFEITVAMAFDHFRNQEVDVAIIETGLGGRLDSTNILNPLLSIITNISFDHQKMLGDRLDQIAAEKAGIIKPNVPVLIGEYQEEVEQVFRKKAKSQNADLYYTHEKVKQREDNFQIGRNTQIAHKGLPKGPYQLKNIRTVLAAMRLLRGLKFINSLDQKVITQGLINVRENVKYMGRWQVLHRKPDIIADSAHNLAGIKSVLMEIESRSYERLHFILGFVKDKSVDKILSLFPKSAKYYLSQTRIPRALDKEELLAFAERQNLKAKSYSSPKRALASAKRCSGKKDGVFVLGSIFLIAEILK